MVEEKQNKLNQDRTSAPVNNFSKDFFISYNDADRTWAEWIAWQLEEAGFSTILQSWDFRPGTNFVLKMQDASKNSKRTIAILSPNYLNAIYTHPEWAAAFKQDPQGTQGRLIPVMVKDCKQELEGLWPQIVYIRLVNLNEQIARKTLLEGINSGRNKPQSPPIFPGDIQHDEIKKPNFPGRAESISSPKISEEKAILPRSILNESFNPYKVRDEWIEYITSNLQEAIKEDETLDFYATNFQGYRQIHILYNQKTIYSLIIYKDSMGGNIHDTGISFSYTEGRSIISKGFNAWGNFKWNSQKEVVVLELLDMSQLSHFGDTKEYTKEEIVHIFWSKIQLAVERSAT